MLVAELKRIEIRKKDREKKSHDINKLITAAESKPIISSNVNPSTNESQPNTSSTSNTNDTTNQQSQQQNNNLRWVFRYLFKFNYKTSKEILVWWL